MKSSMFNNLLRALSLSLLLSITSVLPGVNNAYASTSKVSVYRFYHYSSGSHFYTTSESEKERVITTLSSKYRYEGYKFAGWKSGNSASRVPVERFYRKTTGTHFYTVSPTESARLKRQSDFRYEGVAYYGQKDITDTDDWEGQCPLVRFYNFTNKTHFYTTSYTEAENVILFMDDRYRYEGLSYVVWDGWCNWY